MKHGALLVCLALLLPASSRAQTIDAAQATVLFREGREALAAGDYARACAAFAESASLDMKVGTLLNLADCEEHRGELAQAYAHWQQGIDRATAGRDERLGYLEKRLAALDERVPKLLVRRRDAQTSVTRDGVPLGEASLGRALPVDPGKHTLVASASGRAPKTYVVELREGARAELDLTAEGAPPPPDAPRDAAPSGQGSAPWSAQRTVALAAAGVGVVGVGIGIGFGLSALAKKGRLGGNGQCTASGECSSVEALAAFNATRDDAQSAATASTIALLAGGGALALGAILWLTAAPEKDARAARVRVRVGPGSAQVVGAW